MVMLLSSFRSFGLLLCGCLGWLPYSLHATESVPQSVTELWSNFDPRAEPLDSQLVREWEQEGVVYRYVTFRIGTFRHQHACMAAYFGFPKGAKAVPGLLHLHGGGQRAFLHEVEFYAKRGYACLSINWGGREMEACEPGDPNTNWGAVDPTQNNVAGYFNLQPGPIYLDPQESPRNNNWFLLTQGARRAVTFLEQQQEVDPGKLGVYGHSMGGNLTVYVAGCDDRVKAAAPSVGGSGFTTRPWPLLPEQRKQQPNGDVDLFDATLGFESYAPHVHCPLLWLGSTNDFHGIMDDTYRTGALIKHSNIRYAFTPHMNHRFTPEFAVTRPLWFDQHLKQLFRFPETPWSELRLTTPDHIPSFHVRPDLSLPIDQVHILYSSDPDPQARFWRSASAIRQGDEWIASLPILNVNRPLFAFANVRYRIPNSPSEPQTVGTERMSISSLLSIATPDNLQQSDVSSTDVKSDLIEDFARGWQDWYRLSPDNPHHWEYSTRKLNDLKWQGDVGDQLLIDVQTEQDNELVVVVTVNFFRPYRGPTQEYIATIPLHGGPTGTVTVSLRDLKNQEGTALLSWAQVDLLSLRAYYERNGTLTGSKSWKGPQPQFKRLRWYTAD